MAEDNGVVDYDRISRIYDVSRAAHPETVEKLIKVLNIDSNSVLLDMGCGTGNYTAALQQVAKSVVGIDISPGMIEHARAKFPGLQFICGDVTSLPFDAETFNAVFAIQVLHHVENKEAFLQEAYRVLRKPGYTALHFCSHEQMKAFFFCHYFPRGLAIELERMPDVAEITSLLEETGFSDVGIEICYQDIVVTNETPERYLDADYRDGVSTFSFLSEEEIEKGCKRLQADIASGAVEKIILRQKEKVAEIGGSTVIYGRKL